MTSEFLAAQRRAATAAMARNQAMGPLRVMGGYDEEARAAASAAYQAQISYSNYLVIYSRQPGLHSCGKYYNTCTCWKVD